MSYNNVEDFHMQAGMDLLEGIDNKEAEGEELGAMFSPAPNSSMDGLMEQKNAAGSLRSFDKTDWYGFAGAEPFDDGSEPMTADLPVQNWPETDDAGKPYDSVQLIVDRNGLGIFGVETSMMKPSLGSKEKDVAFAESLFNTPQTVQSLWEHGFEPETGINIFEKSGSLKKKMSADHSKQFKNFALAFGGKLEGNKITFDRDGAHATLEPYQPTVNGPSYYNLQYTTKTGEQRQAMNASAKTIFKALSDTFGDPREKKTADFPSKGYGGDPMSDYGRDAAAAPHPGAVCSECGKTVTEKEYSYGETNCCHAGVVPEEEYGQIDGFTEMNPPSRDAILSAMRDAEREGAPMDAEELAAEFGIPVWLIENILSGKKGSKKKADCPLCGSQKCPKCDGCPGCSGTGAGGPCKCKTSSKKADGKHQFEHDAEIVVGQVLNGGFMQLWMNYGDRKNYNVKTMIMRTAQFFRDKGAEDIAQIFDKAAKINGSIQTRRDSFGNLNDEDYQAEFEARERKFDPLENEFYSKWESNYEGKPDVEDSWKKFFAPDAQKDSQLFRMMMQNKGQAQASVKAASLAKAKLGGGLVYTDADLKALLRSFFGVLSAYVEDHSGSMSELPSEQEVEDMMNYVLSDTPLPSKKQ